MRQLFPEPADVDLLEAYRRLDRTHERPSVRLNMVASLDGAAALGDRSGGLGGPADKAVFATLRALTDVILVGAATMRAEAYRPARLDDSARARRRGMGLASAPPIAVITRACRLEWTTPFFTDAPPDQRPLVITATSAASYDRDRAAEVADVVVAGDDGVDLGRALSALGERGFDNVLAEGGPGVGAQLASSGLLDELCLTVSPLLVGGDAKRILEGNPLEPPTRLELRRVLTSDGFLFLRYGRS